MSMKSNLLGGDDAPSTGYSSTDFGSSSSGGGGVAGYFSTEQTSVSRRYLTLLVGGLVAAAVLVLVLIAALAVRSPAESSAATPAVVPVNPASLSSVLQLSDMMTHLTQLESIALTNNGNRVITQSGFNASVDYVYGVLTSQTDFIVRKQYFPVEAWRVLDSSVSLTSYDSDGFNVSYVYRTDFSAITNSGIQGPNVENATVVLIPNGGCTESDWATANPAPGQIALAERFDQLCNFTVQAQFAVNLKQIGLIVYNTQSDRNILTNLAVQRYTPIPVFLATYTVGTALAAAAQAGKGFWVTMAMNLLSNGTTIVTNIIADTKVGNVSNTIVIGSHLDGVAAGPGVNDNVRRTARPARSTWRLPPD